MRDISGRREPSGRFTKVKTAEIEVEIFKILAQELLGNSVSIYGWNPLPSLVCGKTARYF